MNLIEQLEGLKVRTKFGQGGIAINSLEVAHNNALDQAIALVKQEQDESYAQGWNEGQQALKQMQDHAQTKLLDGFAHSKDCAECDKKKQYIFIKEVKRWGVEAGDYYNPNRHQIVGGTEPTNQPKPPCCQKCKDMDRLLIKGRGGDRIR